MKKYLAFFKMRFIAGLQYRAAAAAGILTQFAWGFLTIQMYAAFYRTNPSAFPMQFSELSSYIWLQQAFLALYTPWYYDKDILEMISSGAVAYELVRPVDLYNMWFLRIMSVRVSRVVLRCIPILIVAAFLPKQYGIGLPYGMINAVMFLITMAGAAICLTAFNMYIYIICFYIINSEGFRMVSVILIDFLSGSEVPIPFMPEGLRRIIELTPFGVMQNLPFRIYSGNIMGAEMWKMFAIQMLWTVVMVIFGKVWMKYAVRRVVVQGG